MNPKINTDNLVRFGVRYENPDYVGQTICKWLQNHHVAVETHHNVRLKIIEILPKGIIFWCERNK